MLSLSMSDGVIRLIVTNALKEPAVYVYMTCNLLSTYRRFWKFCYLPVNDISFSRYISTFRKKLLSAWILPSIGTLRRFTCAKASRCIKPCNSVACHKHFWGTCFIQVRDALFYGNYRRSTAGWRLYLAETCTASRNRRPESYKIDPITCHV